MRMLHEMKCESLRRAKIRRSDPRFGAGARMLHEMKHLFKNCGGKSGDFGNNFIWSFLRFRRVLGSFWFCQKVFRRGTVRDGLLSVIPSSIMFSACHTLPLVCRSWKWAMTRVPRWQEKEAGETSALHVTPSTRQRLNHLFEDDNWHFQPLKSFSADISPKISCDVAIARCVALVESSFTLCRLGKDGW